MTYLIIFLFGLLGIAAHSFIKIKGINERTPEEFSVTKIIKTYLRKDFASIAISIIGVLIWIAFVDARNKAGSDSIAIPGISKTILDTVFWYINVSTALGAFVVESFLIGLFGKTDKFFRKLFQDENCTPQ